MRHLSDLKGELELLKKLRAHKNHTMEFKTLEATNN